MPVPPCAPGALPALRDAHAVHALDAPYAPAHLSRLLREAVAAREGRRLNCIERETGIPALLLPARASRGRAGIIPRTRSLHDAGSREQGTVQAPKIGVQAGGP